ncbi:hypothetical protein J6590_009442 [Homalodisca vitripennis]|nr:hypothetical protein J6590_009442 [Homalodisca vitripennis]
MPVHLLAVGPDCCQLLQSVSQLSRRHVGVTSPTLSGAMGGSMGAVWMEAGPLLLASGGVCYIGDWAKFGSGRSSVASQIVTAIESGQVDLVDSSNTVLGSPASLPLRAAVWTFWSGDKATSAAQTQLRTLIEIFGMPFIGDGSGDIEAVAQHLLLEAMQSDVKPPSCMISPEDLKQKYNDKINDVISLCMITGHIILSSQSMEDDENLSDKRDLVPYADGAAALHPALRYLEQQATATPA